MASLSVRGGSSRIAAVGSCALLLGLVALLCVASGARAAETILWNNFSGDPDTIGFANGDGSGGGTLNLGTETLDSPEGMAYDTVTNRLFVAGYGASKIVAINLDGSGASSFTAPGATFSSPRGVTVDPATRKIYWINSGTETISWANLDGSAGGVLPPTGIDAIRLAIDPVAQRLYWLNGDVGEIEFANLVGSGGGTLSATGATPPSGTTGIAVDPAGGRVYWLQGGKSETKYISYASLAGTGGADLSVADETYNGPYGIALDPTLGRIYWANYGNGTTTTNAFGFLNLAGGGGGINVTTASIKGPQDPLVLKSPSGTGLPSVTRARASRASLSCSTATWGADFPGSFVYQAPRSFAYQWSRNGKAIAGSTAPTLAAKSAGKYTCAVTATNQAGSTAQVSKVAEVKAAKAKLTTKKKVTVKAGGTATFKIKAVNQGDLKSKNAKVCVKVPKNAAGQLKAPKCKKLGKLKGRGKKAATLKIKVLPSASGVYSVSFKVKGSAGKAAKAKIVVVG